MLTEAIMNQAWQLLLLMILTGIGFLLQKYKVTQDRRNLIGTGVELAYGAVNEMARKSPNKIDDKAAEALKKISELLKAENHPPLTAAEEIKVRMAFDAKHALERKLGVAVLSP